MARRRLTVIGWITVRVLHLLWRVLALFGSRWARNKLESSRADRTKNPVVRSVRRRRARHDTAA